MAFSNWPWQYSFPPFFTIQPNIETRAKQLEAWRGLVLDYHRALKQAVLDVSEAERSELFNNTKLQRKLPTEGIIQVLESLAKNGNAEPCNKARTRWYIYWHTLPEWADKMYTWAQETGQTNSVCTLYEIINASDQDFYGLNEEVVKKALHVLERKQKAELILDGENSGVKFF
ncbi:vacuolar protein-sorting-associated protein 25 [Nilaparvata lugens]|uniref:vacuolar protein-sorting-associated protein 25 n=1 Tax=Nilaparvata lugens TaxID=108931 RepID=UPI000B98200B|nr:vacuolar protein-sorting-associated protein 25 [Nilaparvata lugens]